MAFVRTRGTSNNPNIPDSSNSADDYSLILNRGVARIGKTFAANPNFGIERPNSDPTPFSGPGGVACGNDPVNHPGDIRTTDPGHAMVSGAIADVGEFKPPVLRGLAARSPYFHAGMADNIQMLVHFYNARFQIGLTEDEVNDLGAFLEAQ